MGSVVLLLSLFPLGIWVAGIHQTSVVLVSIAGCIGFAFMDAG